MEHKKLYDLEKRIESLEGTISGLCRLHQIQMAEIRGSLPLKTATLEPREATQPKTATAATMETADAITGLLIDLGKKVETHTIQMDRYNNLLEEMVDCVSKQGPLVDEIAQIARGVRVWTAN